MNIAYFISSHGFGHASRSSAIMEMLRILDPSIRFDIFTGTPEWLFRDSHVSGYTFHPGAVDVGLVQSSPMEHDLPASARAIRAYLDELPERSKQLAETMRRLRTDLVVCDISPLGIAAAKAAGLPCILFENFTWDWMYQPYEERFPAFKEIDRELKEIFVLPDARLQSEPLCEKVPACSLLVPPVARMAHEPVADIRARLGIPDDHAMGLITMGGIPEDLEFALNRPVPPKVTLVLPGTFEREEKRGNLVLLPHHSSFYHPDMVRAADFLIGKTGYSTIGEACNYGPAFGYIQREDFRESGVTSAFLQKRPNSLCIAPDHFENFDLYEEIEELLALGKQPPQPVNGSQVAAEYILSKAGK